MPNPTAEPQPQTSPRTEPLPPAAQAALTRLDRALRPAVTQ